MKINIFVQKLEKMLKCRVDHRHSFGRVWSIGGWGDKYVNPDEISIDSLFSIGEHLDRCAAVTETGTIRGPESTSFNQYYKIKGFYISPWRYDGNKAYIFTASKLRNPRFEITERNTR